MSDEQQPGTLTRLLARAGEGDGAAQSQFAEMVYDELRHAAQSLMRRAGSGSLQPTALVDELLLKLCRDECFGKLRNRRYFFTTALDQMQKILIDHRRSRNRLKRGGDRKRVPLDDDEVLDHVVDHFEKENEIDIEALETALRDLEAHSERQYEVVRHRFFGGLTNAQTAELLGVSIGTVEGDWRLARAKLYDQLRGEEE